MSALKEFFKLDGRCVVPAIDKFNVPDFLNDHLKLQLFKKKGNLLCLLKSKIFQFFNLNYRNSAGSPIFSKFEDEARLISIKKYGDMFMADLITTPQCLYFINHNRCLRANIMVHIFDLIEDGEYNFLIVGDVFSPYKPLSHQLAGVRTLVPNDLDEGNFRPETFIEPINPDLPVLRTDERQESHTNQAAQYILSALKTTITNMCNNIFSEKMGEIQLRWVSATFPFTHPSYIVEIMANNKWMEDYDKRHY